MVTHSRPTHRHSCSISSLGSDVEFSDFSGCFDSDEYKLEEHFFGVEEGNLHPLLVPTLPLQDQDQSRPMRRRLGASSAIAAVTSPEIRALDLPPYTSPIRRRTYSNGSTSSTSSSLSTPGPTNFISTPNTSNSLDRYEGKILPGSDFNHHRKTSSLNSVGCIMDLDSILEESFDDMREHSYQRSGSLSSHSYQHQRSGSFSSCGSRQDIDLQTISNSINQKNLPTQKCDTSKITALTSTKTNDKKNLPPKVPINRERLFGHHRKKNYVIPEEMRAPSSYEQIKKELDDGKRIPAGIFDSPNEKGQLHRTTSRQMNRQVDSIENNFRVFDQWHDVKRNDTNGGSHQNVSLVMSQSVISKEDCNFKSRQLTTESSTSQMFNVTHRAQDQQQKTNEIKIFNGFQASKTKPKPTRERDEVNERTKANNSQTELFCKFAIYSDSTSDKVGQCQPQIIPAYSSNNVMQNVVTKKTFLKKGKNPVIRGLRERDLNLNAS